MKPTLVTLAAGLGSRYGGLKQMESFGPHGETLMDYTLHDALAAGFAKVVFVIRRGFAADFRAVVGRKVEKRVAVDYVFQEMEELPPGCAVPAARAKPWGTAHAVWCARGRVQEPFCCANADDYYGKSAFRAVAEHLLRSGTGGAGHPPEHCIVGYPILQTLSDHGGVARAICEVDEQGFLTSLLERTGVEKSGETGKYVDETGHVRFLAGNEVVSMNMMGFTLAVFPQLESGLVEFFAAQKRAPDDSECLLPMVVGKVVKNEGARVRVLPTADAWFGVTHAQDKPGAIERIRAMVERGEYPSPIWGND
ncbi:MAG: nucleotidyltransferase [Deltaproteobacteria bacterium]|nr:nucleotidyltransferase [Deltaproteobacteria bacterium]